MLFTSILSARLYGITVIGQAALALAPVAIVTLLSTVREQPAMVRELAKLQPRHPRVTGVFLAVFTFSFALTAAVTAIGLVVCYFVFRGPLHEPGLFAPAATGLCGYLLIINTCWNIDGVLGAFRAGRELFAVRLHQAVVYGVLIAAFTLVTHSVWGLVAAFLGSWLTALIHRLFILPRIVRWRVPIEEIRTGFSTLREIVKFGLKLTPGSLAASLSDTSGTWILGVTRSVEAVGAYSRAWTLVARLGELNWRITEMLLPTLVQHRHTGDNERFDRVLMDSLRYAAFGMLLPAAVGGGAADAVMRTFGAGFGAAAPALRWLLFVPVLQTIIAIQGTALMASNRPLLTAIAQFLRLTVTIAGGVALALALGVTGMAIAMTAGAAVSSCAYLVLLRLNLGIPIPTLTHYRQIAGFGVAYASGFAVSHLLECEISGILGLAIALLAGSVVYVVFGVGVGGVTHRDRTRLKDVARRLTKDRILSAEMSGSYDLTKPSLQHLDAKHQALTARKTAMRSCLVMGSDRSGTSMLAGMLHAAGYYVGNQLLPPTSSNPKGYFEDRTINGLNEDLLIQLLRVKRAGIRGRLYPWRTFHGHRWIAPLDIEATVHATPEITDQMQSITSRRPFCLKDPRFCHTIDAWRPVLGDAVFLCVFREPGRTATSMIAEIRKQTRLQFLHISRRRALHAWARAYEHILIKHMTQGEWLFVHYDQIFDGSAVPRIEEFLGTSIDASFVDRSLNRSTASTDIPRSTADIYERLCELAGYQPAAGDRANGTDRAR